MLWSCGDERIQNMTWYLIFCSFFWEKPFFSKYSVRLLQKFNYPISCPWSLSRPLENLITSPVFWCFQGYRKGTLALYELINLISVADTFNVMSQILRTQLMEIVRNAKVIPVYKVNQAYKRLRKHLATIFFLLIYTPFTHIEKPRTTMMRWLKLSKKMPTCVNIFF